jgi:hypothetical protein
VGGAIVEALDALDLRFPTIDAEARAAFQAARATLDHDDD